MYLGRLCTEEDKERYDNAKVGGDGPICSDNDGGSNYLSSVDVRPNYDALGSDVARAVARKNAMATMARHSFFFYGDSLDVIQDSITTLAKEPRDMEGFNALDRGTETIDDCFAADRPHMMVIKMPLEKFEEMCNMGLIGTGSCEYGPDYAKVELDEAILGDDAMRRIFAGEAEIVALDTPENVYEDVFGADYDALFSRGKRRTLRRDDYGYGDDFGGGYGDDNYGDDGYGLDDY